MKSMDRSRGGGGGRREGNMDRGGSSAAKIRNRGVGGEEWLANSFSRFLFTRFVVGVGGKRRDGGRMDGRRHERTTRRDAAIREERVSEGKLASRMADADYESSTSRQPRPVRRYVYVYLDACALRVEQVRNARDSPPTIPTNVPPRPRSRSSITLAFSPPTIHYSPIVIDKTDLLRILTRK